MYTHGCQLLHFSIGDICWWWFLVIKTEQNAASVKVFIAHFSGHVFPTEILENKYLFLLIDWNLLPGFHKGRVLECMGNWCAKGPYRIAGYRITVKKSMCLKSTVAIHLLLSTQLSLFHIFVLFSFNALISFVETGKIKSNIVIITY